MKLRIVFCLSIYILINTPLFSQNVGINSTGVSPDNSAMLDISSTNKGLLIPNIALTGTTDVTTIPSPAISLLIYNTATVGILTPGYYYWNGTSWQRLLSGTVSSDWTLIGNAGTVDGTNFIGTTDNVPFNIRVNNQKAGRIESAGSVFLGYQAGNTNTGTTNVGIGLQSLAVSTGAYNVAFGTFSLRDNTTGGWNTAVGDWALKGNTTGRSNTGIGNDALYQNTTGSYNTGIGTEALSSNTSGIYNTGIGSFALYLNTTGNDNTGIGSQALLSNTTGTRNTAVGKDVMLQNTSGNNNTAFGYQSLLNNSTGNYNSSYGTFALRMNITGSNNTASGFNALINSSVNDNTASGYQALVNTTTGALNTAFGSSSGLMNTTGSNNTFIGYNTNASANNLTNATAIGANAIVGASNALVLGSNANVGIGTSSPSNLLSLLGASDQLSVSNPTNDGSISILFNENTNSNSARIHHEGDFSSGYLEIEDYSAGWANTGLVVKQNNVGIGTSSPGAKLEVAGQVKITGGSPGAGKVLTSDAFGLASWTDPSAQQPWQNVTFQNGWTNLGGPWATCQYFKDSQGFVHIKGVIANGSAYTTIFNLPVGYRPNENRIFACQSCSGTSERVDVYPNGDVAASPGNSCWTSLEIVFRP